MICVNRHLAWFICSFDFKFTKVEAEWWTFRPNGYSSTNEVRKEGREREDKSWNSNHDLQLPAAITQKCCLSVPLLREYIRRQTCTMPIPFDTKDVSMPQERSLLTSQMLIFLKSCALQFVLNIKAFKSRLQQKGKGNTELVYWF